MNTEFNKWLLSEISRVAQYNFVPTYNFDFNDGYKTALLSVADKLELDLDDMYYASIGEYESESD